MKERTVLVAGAGVSGVAAAETLVATGAHVFVSDDRPEALQALPEGARAWKPAPGGEPFPEGTSLIVTSPGRRPDHPLVAQAAARAIELIGEPELAWRLGRPRAAGGAPAPDWLVVTGTNGKTTATGMLAAILTAAGLDAVACGNIGYPVVSAVAAGHRVLAVELSSFQLHWSPSIRPAAGAVLNVADDHLDWHGSLRAYAEAKARALTGDVAVAGVDDEIAAALLAASPAPRRVGVTLADPAPGQLGVAGGWLVDRAFGAAVPETGAGLQLGAQNSATRGGTLQLGGRNSATRVGEVPVGVGVRLAEVASVRPGGPPGLTDALVAAALARAYGVPAEAVAAGLAAFTPGAHRSVLVGTVAGVHYVDDSKATNPHAADAALAAHGTPGGKVVWILGGLLKGARVDDVVARHAGRLRAAVVIGTDRAEIMAALTRHAPEVPACEVTPGDDGPMPTAVRRAAAFAEPGDTVLLAPTAASMDQFRDYAARGDAFAAAVADLAEEPLGRPGREAGAGREAG